MGVLATEPRHLSVEEMDGEQLAESNRQAEDRLYELARKDFNVFAQLVCVDDETGEPIQQGPIHRKWAKYCDAYPKVLLWAHRYAGKTVQLSILRTVWKLGRDPSLRFIVLSATQDLAKAIIAAIATYIENNEQVRRIFPKLVKDPKGLWSSTNLDIVGKRDPKNSSVKACGVTTAVRGSRCDELVVDDILTPENTSTADQRKKVSTWLRSEAFGCLAKRGRIVIVGNAMHPDDVLHELAKLKNFAWFKFPILDKAGKSTWPSAWPMDRIEEHQILMGPAEFAKNMMCRARADEDSRFKQEWIDEAIKRGVDLSLVDHLDELPDGCQTFTGVDIGVKRKKKSDLTVFFTFIEDSVGHRTVLNIRAGKYTGPQIVSNIIECHERYHSIIAVENNAAQDFILQFASDISNVPVMPHTTSKKKRDPILGVEGLAIELSNNKWTFPNKGGVLNSEIAAFITEMLYYSPGAHTGDRLMACYFARELARILMSRQPDRPSVQVSVIGEVAEIAANNDERGELESLFDVPEEPAEPGAAVVASIVEQLKDKLAARIAAKQAAVA